MSRPKILVITPVRHINGVLSILEKTGEVVYLPEATEAEAASKIGDSAAIFTNPNKSNVFISKKLIDAAPSLKTICTASTGTNHIDLAHAKEKGIRVISLTEERETINKISSTAELAFALMLAALRKIPQGWDSVKRGEWDYEPYIGRQVDHLTVGVVGYGRLGSLFAGYAKAFRAKVLAHDPYKKAYETGVEPVGIHRLLRESDVISLHVHANAETVGMVGRDWFEKMKTDALLVNTARGDVVDEAALVEFLKKNPKACYASDVLANETFDRGSSPVLKYALAGGRVLLTPHVGGMTVEGQRIAYTRAASLLQEHLSGGKVS